MSVFKKGMIKMKYIIKKTYVALEDSKYIKKGYTDTWYMGKGIISSKDENDTYVMRNGYDRKCDAVRRFNLEEKGAKIESVNGFWQITHEILEVNI